MKTLSAALSFMILLGANAPCGRVGNADGARMGRDEVVHQMIETLVFLELISMHVAPRPTFCLALRDGAGLATVPAGMLDALAAHGHEVRDHSFCHDAWRRAPHSPDESLMFILTKPHEDDRSALVEFTRSSGTAFRHPLGLGESGGKCVLTRQASTWQVESCSYEWVS